ncbi:MAG1360 family OppF-related protein [Mycoplasmopsis meleagridis]|uniref:MAG1360 family OppF-related protein n=1 Tax=Mycoplasmopsis meleagridis TaxID=29561 RepID=UPI003A8631CC
MDKKILFSLENFIEIFSKDDFNAVKQIDIYEKNPTLFFVDNKDNFLFKNNALNKIFTDKHTIKNLIINENDEYSIYYKDKDILPHIKILNLKDINNSNKEAVFIQKFHDIKKYFANSNEERIKSFNETTNKYKYALRKILFNSLSQYILNINNSIKQLNELKRKIDINNFFLSEKDILEKIDNFHSANDNLIINSVINIYEIINDLKIKFDFFIKSNDQSLDFLGDTKIKHVEESIKINKIISSKGEQYLINKLQIRDHLKNLDFLIDSKNKYIKRRNNTYFNYLINWYKSNIANKKYILKKIKRKTSAYLLTYKELAINSHIYRLIQKNRKAFLSFNSVNLRKFKKELDFQSKLFIANNLNSNKFNKLNNFENKINKIMKKQFAINFEQYRNSNYEILNDFNSRINENKNAINKLKKEKILTDPYPLSKNVVYALNEQLKILKSEYDWKNKNIAKSYYAKLKYNPWLANSIDTFKNSYLEILNKYKILCIKTEEKFGLHSPVTKAFTTKYNYYSSFMFFFNLLVKIKNFIILKNKLTNVDVGNFLSFSNLIDILRETDVDIRKILQYNSFVSFKDNLKINLLSILITNPKLIFIVDDFNNSNLKEKIEFLSDMNKLMLKENRSFVFITHNKNFIDNTMFNNIYLFNKNRLLEYGNINKIINKSFYKFREVEDSQSYFLANNTLLNDYLFTDNFILENEHNAITSASDILNWYNHNTPIDTVSISYSTEDEIENEIKNKTALVNPLDNLEFFISDFTNKHTKESNIK